MHGKIQGPTQYDMKNCTQLESKRLTGLEICNNIRTQISELYDEVKDLRGEVYGLRGDISEIKNMLIKAVIITNR